ncbi:MAG: hypothetical protein ABJI60_06490 [Kangiellaceae bacterium]
MNKSPNIEELLECGVSLAEELGMEVPPREMFNSKIDEVLFERENYECAKSGLITNDELVNLVIAHFQTLVCNNSYADKPSELKLSAVLRSRIQSALLG